MYSLSRRNGSILKRLAACIYYRVFFEINWKLHIAICRCHRRQTSLKHLRYASPLAKLSVVPGFRSSSTFTELETTQYFRRQTVADVRTSSTSQLKSFRTARITWNLTKGAKFSNLPHCPRGRIVGEDAIFPFRHLVWLETAVRQFRKTNSRYNVMFLSNKRMGTELKLASIQIDTFQFSQLFEARQFFHVLGRETENSSATLLHNRSWL